MRVSVSVHFPFSSSLTMKRILTPLFASLLLLPAVRAEVQLLHAFEFGARYPQSRLVQASDGNFYGVASSGGASATLGSSGNGCVFRVTPTGVISTVVSFLGTNGASPQGALVLGPGGVLFGTTKSGGANNRGTVFSLTTGGVLTTLCSFFGTNGANPQTALTFGNDGALYGTTLWGGANDRGSIFRVTTGGSLMLLHSLATSNAWPGSSLCLAPDGNLYGTTQQGPANGGGAFPYGTIYRLTPGGQFTQLLALTNLIGTVSYPDSWLTLHSDGVMYGTLAGGSTNNIGCVYSLTTNGTFTPLVAFGFTSGGRSVGGLTPGPDGNFYGAGTFGGAAGDGTVFRVQPPNVIQTNWIISQVAYFQSYVNGSSPNGGLTLGSDGNFYGATTGGGDATWGAFFRVPTNGPVTALASFHNDGGIAPGAALTLAADGRFYGTTCYGGPGDYGTIFRVATDGAFTSLATFGGTNGSNPAGPLCLGPNGALYGGALYGGTFNGGTLFSITTSGVFKTVFQFATATNGAWPQGGMTLGADGFLYGTTITGGPNSGQGTVFKFSSNGTLTTLAVFRGTNGARPKGTLLYGGDGFFYGTTSEGGTNSNNGVIFRCGTNGGLIVLKHMVYATGGTPEAGLARGADGAFYGTTTGGGPGGNGVIFRVTTNGDYNIVNSQFTTPGSVQHAGLTPGPDGHFYGATLNGGANSVGNVFRLTTSSAWALLSTLTRATGGNPFAPPVFGPDGNLYGTGYSSGPGGGGSVWRFVPDHITDIQRSVSNATVIATGTAGGKYSLQAHTNLTSDGWSNVASATALAPGLVQLNDTNAWRFPQRFYRTTAQ